MSSFTRDMSQIANADFLGGLVIKAQGDLIKKQTLATQDIITNFSKRLQQFESEPLKVEEQLSRLNEDPDVKDNMVSLQDMIADYQTLTHNLFERQVRLNTVYGDTINALSMVGSKESEQLMKTLAAQHGMKSGELERIRNMPFESLQYQKTILDIENTKFSLQESGIKLQELRESVAAQRIFADMIVSDEFTDLRLAFNTASGRHSYDLAKFRDSMWLRYGHDENFVRAWKGVDEYIRKNIEKFRPEIRQMGGDGEIKSYMDNLMFMKGLYNDLRDTTAKIGQLQYDPKYQWARDEYHNTALLLYGQPDTNKPNDLWKYSFGSDPAVIAKMEKDAKAEAKYVYDMIYDKKNVKGYWSGLQQLQKGLGVETVSAYLGNIQKPDPTDPKGYAIFDISQLITDSPGLLDPEDPEGEKRYGGGWWNPYEPQKSLKESYAPFIRNITKEPSPEQLQRMQEIRWKD